MSRVVVRILNVSDYFLSHSFNMSGKFSVVETATPLILALLIRERHTFIAKKHSQVTFERVYYFCFDFTSERKAGMSK